MATLFFKGESLQRYTKKSTGEFDAAATRRFNFTVEGHLLERMFKQLLQVYPDTPHESLNRTKKHIESHSGFKSVRYDCPKKPDDWDSLHYLLYEELIQLELVRPRARRTLHVAGLPRSGVWSYTRNLYYKLTTPKHEIFATDGLRRKIWAHLGTVFKKSVGTIRNPFPLEDKLQKYGRIIKLELDGDDVDEGDVMGADMLTGMEDSRDATYVTVGNICVIF
ncbi:hypothetical protein CVT24_009855 [Panaeolus cyanescens]|uniref:Uncharacterized protein n=1 Tax=Panaeolus cyanescens TaxID=181874 RepID=A0A409X0U8_9AGAR|nr:hypothetical protein CVT24_009855 [Panaeolus cyanescens]